MDDLADLEARLAVAERNVQKLAWDNSRLRDHISNLTCLMKHVLDHVQYDHTPRLSQTQPSFPVLNYGAGYVPTVGWYERQSTLSWLSCHQGRCW